MLGDMFPQQIRGSGLAVAGVAPGLAGGYGLYALAAALLVVFVRRHAQETRGNELQEMEG